jgi:hypothetical protein
MSHKFRTNVEIISSAANTSGLRLNNLTATNTNTYTGVLVHDANGVVMSTSASNLAIVTV